jgi:hypothetical protein
LSSENKKQEPNIADSAESRNPAPEDNATAAIGEIREDPLTKEQKEELTKIREKQAMRAQRAADMERRKKGGEEKRKRLEKQKNDAAFKKLAEGNAVGDLEDEWVAQMKLWAWCQHSDKNAWEKFAFMMRGSSWSGRRG